MYEPPIQIISKTILDDMATKQEEAVYRAIMQQEIHVDKEELVKALQYDRGQYEKGYADGIKEFAERLKKKIDGADWWGSVVSINELTKEMVGDAE